MLNRKSRKKSEARKAQYHKGTIHKREPPESEKDTSLKSIKFEPENIE